MKCTTTSHKQSSWIKDIPMRSLSGSIYIMGFSAVFLSNNPLIHYFFGHAIFLIMLSEFYNIVYAYKWRLNQFGHILLHIHLFAVLIYAITENVDLASTKIAIVGYCLILLLSYLYSVEINYEKVTKNDEFNEQKTQEISKNNTKIYIFLILGYFCAILFIESLFFLRKKISSYNLLLIFLSVCFTDIGGYIIGNIIKGPKLAPKISPQKTLSGFIGAIIAGTLFYYCSGKALQMWSVGLEIKNVNLIFAFFISTMAVLGDLLQSRLKRMFKVKDSGYVITGHGGFLDRIDSLFLVSIILSLYYLCAVSA